MGNSVVHKKLLYRVEYSDYYNRTSQIWLPVDIAPGSELYQQLLAYQAGNLGDEGLARHLLSYHFNRDFSGDGAHWDYNGQIVERVPTISVVRIDDTVESEGESNNDFNFEDTDEDNIVSENKDEGNEENSSNGKCFNTSKDCFVWFDFSYNIDTISCLLCRSSSCYRG